MRLDARLVAEGLAPSRSRAQALIKAGVVRIDGALAAKPSQDAPPEAAVALDDDPCPWVSRGALKLIAALDRFGLDPSGRRALDIGSSTGGFTEVLLARGAAHVTAVDVGTGQMAPALAADPRVTLFEGLNAKALTASAAPEPVGALVADVSFISLVKALPAPMALTRPGAWAAVLVKPQFELGPAHISKGGLVRDAAAREAAAAQVGAFFEAAGWRVIGSAVSPVLGGGGAVEHLLAAERPVA